MTRPFSLSLFPHSNCNSLFRRRTGKGKKKRACDWRVWCGHWEEFSKFLTLPLKERERIRRERDDEKNPREQCSFLFLLFSFWGKHKKAVRVIREQWRLFIALIQSGDVCVWNWNRQREGSCGMWIPFSLCEFHVKTIKRKGEGQVVAYQRCVFVFHM